MLYRKQEAYTDDMDMKNNIKLYVSIECILTHNEWMNENESICDSLLYNSSTHSIHLYVYNHHQNLLYLLISKDFMDFMWGDGYWGSDVATLDIDRVKEDVSES